MDSSDVASAGEVFKGTLDFSQETLILCRYTVFVRELRVEAMLHMGMGDADPGVHSSGEFATQNQARTALGCCLLSLVPTTTDLFCCETEDEGYQRYRKGCVTVLVVCAAVVLKKSAQCRVLKALGAGRRGTRR